MVFTILYISNDSSATWHLPFLVWDSIQATTGELWPRNCLQSHFAPLVVDFWGFRSIIPGVAHIVKPHPDYWPLNWNNDGPIDAVFHQNLGNNSCSCVTLFDTLDWWDKKSH